MVFFAPYFFKGTRIWTLVFNDNFLEPPFLICSLWNSSFIYKTVKCSQLSRYWLSRHKVINEITRRSNFSKVRTLKILKKRELSNFTFKIENIRIVGNTDYHGSCFLCCSRGRWNLVVPIYFDWGRGGSKLIRNRGCCCFHLAGI